MRVYFYKETEGAASPRPRDDPIGPPSGGTELGRSFPDAQPSGRHRQVHGLLFAHREEHRLVCQDKCFLNCGNSGNLFCEASRSNPRVSSCCSSHRPHSLLPQNLSLCLECSAELPCVHLLAQVSPSQQPGLSLLPCHVPPAPPTPPNSPGVLVCRLCPSVGDTLHEARTSSVLFTAVSPGPRTARGT